MDDIEDTELNNGVVMPRLGLGVFLMEKGEETERSVRWALEDGYRLIDTASLYENEEEVGAAVRESGIPREEVFVTTKLWNSDQGYEPALEAFEQSLGRLGLEYVDLYLIHWPVPGSRLESWKALEEIYAGGRCRAIGVSNYTARHLEELMGTAEVVPAVNQIQFHPFCYGEGTRSTRDYCRKNGILLEAYSPLTRARKLSHPVLRDTASRYGKTPAQLLLRWGLEHGAAVIPKTVHRDRLRENMDVFDFRLSSSDMETLDSLDEGFFIGWDPGDLP